MTDQLATNKEVSRLFNHINHHYREILFAGSLAVARIVGTDSQTGTPAQLNQVSGIEWILNDQGYELADNVQLIAIDKSSGPANSEAEIGHNPTATLDSRPVATIPITGGVAAANPPSSTTLLKQEASTGSPTGHQPDTSQPRDIALLPEDAGTFSHKSTTDELEASSHLSFGDTNSEKESSIDDSGQASNTPSAPTEGADLQGDNTNQTLTTLLSEEPVASTQDEFLFNTDDYIESQANEDTSASAELILLGAGAFAFTALVANRLRAVKRPLSANRE